MATKKPKIGGASADPERSRAMMGNKNASGRHTIGRAPNIVGGKILKGVLGLNVYDIPKPLKNASKAKQAQFVKSAIASDRKLLLSMPLGKRIRENFK